MKENKTCKFVCVFALMGNLISQAAVTGYTNSFSSASDVNGWVSAGAVPAQISWTGKMWAHDYDDGDATQVLAYAEGMKITGDGVLSDGLLKLDTVNAVALDEAMGCTLSGTLDKGETITFSGNMCAGSAYNRFYAQIWDATADRVLAETKSIQVLGYKDVKSKPVDFSVSYTATEAEIGHTVQIRFLGNSITASDQRDLYVDNVMVTSSPGGGI